MMSAGYGEVSPPGEAQLHTTTCASGEAGNSLRTMFGPNSKTPASIALLGCVLGLLFSGYSALDYADHLDRALHDIHCSYVPGASPTAEAEACRAAMYSSYGALFRESLWGGVPVGLFAMGAFSFLAGFAVYLLIAGAKASSRSLGFFAVVGVTPLIVSIVMLFIAVTQLGTVCKTCVGIYISSALVALGGLLGLATLRQAPETIGYPPRPRSGMALALVWLGGLGAATLVPCLVYAAKAPDHRPYLARCGQIKTMDKPNLGLVQLKTRAPVQDALMFEDPLCATCKAFHQRLVSEGILPRLRAKVAMFPLDSSCNWMLDRSLHPGACAVSKAVLCGGDRAQEVLEWAYEEQEYLLRAGNEGDGTIRAVIQRRWGDDMLRCVDSRKTQTTLNEHLHFAADNGIAVSTPQLFLGKQRVCDEDTDIGLRYTMKQLAPEVLQ